MGRNSIERGKKDTWSFSPKKIEAINDAAKSDKSATMQVVMQILEQEAAMACKRF